MRLSTRPPWRRQASLLPWLSRPPPQNLVPRRIATTSAANAAPVDIPKVVITPGSSHHNSLPSFIEYAKRTKLARSTTVYVGTHFEYVSALALQRLGFSLLRVGRRFDAGIDLVGHWVLAPLREPLPVIIQCKARQRSTTPAHVRELEGSFHGVPPHWRNKAVLGLLVTNKKATKGVLEALGKSQWPMGFVLVTLDGTVQQFLWNRAASEQGLEGVSVTVRHTPLSPDSSPTPPNSSSSKKRKSAKPASTGTKKDIQLTWMGSPIFADRGDTLDPETIALMSDVLHKRTANQPRPRKKVPQTIPDDQLSAAGIAASAHTLEPEDDMRGRPRTEHMDPLPRGGEVDAHVLCDKLIVAEQGGEWTGEEKKKRKRGRPLGSKNKPRLEIVGKRGRPAGTKNKKSPVEKTEENAADPLVLEDVDTG